MSENFSQYLYQELSNAYETARLGKRRTVDEHKFEINDVASILELRRQLLTYSYKPSSGVTFIIHDPVTREIVAAPFSDRIVHHFLFNHCADWWDRRFLPDSYSCRKGKGTLYGQQRLARHIQIASENYTRPVKVMKLDIQGYFMSLNRKRLYRRVRWGLERQFNDPVRDDNFNCIRCLPCDRQKLFNLLDFTWRQVIFDEPMENIKIRGRSSDWDTLPANKSLFRQPPGQGIVIGNLTSQLLSNIYLDQLDRFIFFDLGYEHYGRYVDDFYIVIPEDRSDQLLRDVGLIECFLKEKLGLVLHPKKRYFQDARKGVPFVGAIVYPRHIIPSHRFCRNFRRAAYKLATTGEGGIEGLVARMGSVSHINHRKYFRQIFDELGWDFNWVEQDLWEEMRAQKIETRNMLKW